MVGAHQRNRKTAEIRRAAAIHWIEVLQALRNEPHAEIVIRRDRGAGRLGNVEGVADMIAVAMSEHDMFDPFAGGRFVGNESGIAGEEWIDQDCVAGKVEAKGGVTIPSDLHGGTLRLRMLAAPNNSRAASCGKAPLAAPSSRRFRVRANDSLCRFFHLPRPSQYCRRAAR